MKRRKGKKHIVETFKEHGLTDTKYPYVGIAVDISNYTNVISPLSFQGTIKVQKYHCIFSNTMKAIARNFGAEVVEKWSGGDKVFSFFPNTSKPSSDKTPFKDVLKCGLAMQAAHDDMNKKYHEDGLPPINYRISADCGKTQRAVIAMCYNIYKKVPPNGMVIGESLYDMINDSFESDYHFTKIYEYPPDKDPDMNSDPVFLNTYSVYLISVKTGVNVAVPAIVMPPELGIKDRKVSGWNLEEGAQKSNIMLIDDEPDMIIKYKSFLHPEGHKVDAFSNSQEALRHFARVSPSYYDLVIMDIRVRRFRPNLNSLQLYNRMKAINSSVKVLFVSAPDAIEELVSILPDIKRKSIIRKPVEKIIS